MRKVYWRKKALNAFQRQKLWYLVNKDEQFVNTYQENIVSTIERITFMPSIGVLVKKSNDKEYRKLLAHPKSWIYYWYDNNELHILDIRSSVMK